VAPLALDPDRFELPGFLVFPRIGVTTTGYHDDYPSDQALTVFPEGAWDKYLPRASAPDLSPYRSR